MIDDEDSISILDTSNTEERKKEREKNLRYPCIFFLGHCSGSVVRHRVCRTFVPKKERKKTTTKQTEYIVECVCLWYIWLLSVYVLFFQDIYINATATMFPKFFFYSFFSGLEGYFFLFAHEFFFFLFIQWKQNCRM